MVMNMYEQLESEMWPRFPLTLKTVPILILSTRCSSKGFDNSVRGGIVGTRCTLVGDIDGMVVIISFQGGSQGELHGLKLLSAGALPSIGDHRDCRGTPPPRVTGRSVN